MSQANTYTECGKKHTTKKSFYAFMLKYYELLLTYVQMFAIWLLYMVMVGCVAQLAERRSLAGELTLSCTRPAADG